jgi:hypothetical protein
VSFDQHDPSPVSSDALETVERTLRADLAAATPPPPPALRGRVLATLAPRRRRGRRTVAVAAGLLLALSASLLVGRLFNGSAETVEAPLSVARLLPDMGELMERHAERVGDGAARPFLREVELLVEDSDRVTAAFLRSLPAPLLKGLPARVAARAGS